jgi:glycosyltransferase involved in cell wall biosynthesis
MFEYMAAGLPIIASDFPRWRGIIEGSACGILVDPLDPRAIAEAMRWILENPLEATAMGERGRRAVERGYNWNVEATKLIDLYDRLLQNGR